MRHARRPQRERLEVGEVSAIRPWKTFFEGVKRAVAGHTGLGSVNCFKFVRHGDVQMGGSPENLSLDVQDAGVKLVDDDVVMLVKQFIHSTSLCQQPQLFLRSSDLADLDRTVLWTAMKRNLLSKESVKQYQRTARLVEKDPWFHTRAADYLRKWVDQNEKQDWGSHKLFELEFVMKTRDAKLEPENSVFWHQFAPDPPKVVAVHCMESKGKAAKPKASSTLPKTKSKPIATPPKASGMPPKASSPPPKASLTLAKPPSPSQPPSPSSAKLAKPVGKPGGALSVPPKMILRRPSCSLAEPPVKNTG